MFNIFNSWRYSFTFYETQIRLKLTIYRCISSKALLTASSEKTSNLINFFHWLKKTKTQYISIISKCNRAVCSKDFLLNQSRLLGYQKVQDR